MTLLEAIFLGIVQGATEFLPISSSGHTVLVPNLLNLGQPSLDLIAFAHLGTLLAVLVYFFSDISQIVAGVVAGLLHGRPLENGDARLGWLILAGSLPAAILGLALESFVEDIFARPLFAACFLLVTATLLVAGERLLTGYKPIPCMGWLDAVVVGLFQALALLPGISRSGSTITGGLWRGLDREAAARFSFLLSIPAILGAGLLALLDLRAAGGSNQLPIYLGAFTAAAVTGYACIYLLLAWLRQHSLYAFAVYCALFGSLYLLLALLNVV